MSTTTNSTTDRRAETDNHSETDVPAQMPELIRWLDDQPNFVEFQYETTVKLGRDNWGRAKRHTRQRTGLTLLPDDYEVTSRASHQSQPAVATAFKKGQFPSHNVETVDGRKAAHLYTRSSYKTGVDGPSSFDPWEGQQAPTTAYQCSECDFTKTPNRGRRTSIRAERKVNEHIETEHDSGTVYEKTGSWRTESEINFSAYQFFDGSGYAEHYDRKAAIRTRSGEIIDNTQNFARGRARRLRLAGHSNRTNKLPLTAIEQMLADEPEDIYDFVEVRQDDLDDSGGHVSYRTKRQKARIGLLESGRAIVVFYDETANNWNESYCGCLLDADEVGALRTVDDIYELLKPDEVAAAESNGLSIVGSQDYGRPFRDKREGDAVIRQGEWWLLPMPADFEPDTPTYYRGTYHTGWLIDSLAQDAGISNVTGLRTTCAACGESSFTVAATHYTCTDCDHVHADGGGKTIADGRIEEFIDRDDLCPTDALGSHKPRDLAADADGTLYVRGTVRHIGNDHNMINVDRWHKAIEGPLDDVVVFNTGAGDTTGRSGADNGVLRYD